MIKPKTDFLIIDNHINANNKASILGVAVDVATQGILDNNKTPGRKVGQPDNRDSHYYFVLYWAQAIATQTEDIELANHFAPIAKCLKSSEAIIINEL